MSITDISAFISEISSCHDKDQERLRVDKELGHIRTSFKNEKGLTSYNKKKYVWKMFYIFMLGYNVDFGHMEVILLMSASRYDEKQVGYLVTSCLLNENHDILRLAINTIHNDIISNNEAFQCLALTLAGNICSGEFVELLASDVQNLLISTSYRPLVKKKAALCLVGLFRKNPEVINVDVWADQMAMLLDECNLGVLTSFMSLFITLVSVNNEAYWSCLPKCIKVLERLARKEDIPREYGYFGTPAPWLQVKTMRALQYFPIIEDLNTRTTLMEVLEQIIKNTVLGKNVNMNNASHAVLFEAIALLLHHFHDEDEEVILVYSIFSQLLTDVREPNIRHLTLENISRMLAVTRLPDIIKRYKPQIINKLKNPDSSVRRIALDLLYVM